MPAICMGCKMHGLSWLYNLYAGCYQCFDTSMATGQVVDSQWLYLVVGIASYVHCKDEKKAV